MWGDEQRLNSGQKVSVALEVHGRHLECLSVRYCPPCDFGIGEHAVNLAAVCFPAATPPAVTQDPYLRFNHTTCNAVP